ncbi:unnamed protein product [Lactuca virosa]|uniref:AT-hook motif nuclear-localized protein n=1 Tax=Lactuca virosa TaxID=75947 RepID=A0AAU9PC81_9ASTR|nr:unnamed protein product [Lactuca virosa]
MKHQGNDGVESSSPATGGVGAKQETEASPFTKENRDSAINRSNSLLDAMNLKNANGKSTEEAVKVSNVNDNRNILAAEPNYSTSGEPIVGPASPGTNIFGPIQNLMSSGCSGPFPNTIPIQFSSLAAYIGDSVSGSESNTSGSKPRKRKRIKTNTRSSSHLTHPIPLPNLPIPFPNTQPNRQIDLNANQTVNLTTQSETKSSLPSNPCEFQQVVAIGTKLGFILTMIMESWHKLLVSQVDKLVINELIIIKYKKLGGGC